MESDLGHELGEARVGADGVGHGIDVQVDQAVDAFLVGEVEQAEGFVRFAQADVDSCRVQIRNETCARELLQLLESCSSFLNIPSQGLGVAISHEHRGIVTGELAGALKGFDGLRIHFLLAIGGAEPELRQQKIGMEFDDLLRFVDGGVILPTFYKNKCITLLRIVKRNFAKLQKNFLLPCFQRHGMV
jgi:hypothetical protein